MYTSTKTMNIRTKIPKWLILSVSGIFFIVGISLVFNAIISLQGTFQKKAWESQRQSLAEEKRNNYAALSEKQARETPLPNVFSNASATNYQTPLRGDQKVTVVFVRPAQLAVSEVQPLITTLESSDSSRHSSLGYINTYLQKQANYYNPAPFNVRVVTTPLLTMQSLTYVGDIGNPWEKDAFGTTKLQDDFEKIVKEQALPADEPVIFLYFDPFTGADISTKRFYDNQEFRSFADERQKRAYINVYSLSPAFAPTVNEIIIHELLHMYGATDKYLESTRGCTTEGWLTLPYPYTTTHKETADMMCGYLKTQSGALRMAQFEDDEIIINTLTAQEIGWKQPSLW